MSAFIVSLLHHRIGEPWGLRVYDVPPSIWNSKNNCDHEWGTEILAKHASNWETFQWNDGRPSHASKGWKEKVMNSKIENCGMFCQKCGAWQGCLGQEPTMEMYIEHLVQIFSEVKRVLRSDGTFWLNIGDSYAGSGSPGGDFRDGKKGDIYLRPYKRRGKGLKTKDQCLIPHRITLALQGFVIVYADEIWELANTLRKARAQSNWDAVKWVEEVLRQWALMTKIANSAGWWVRSTIIWQKENCLPSSATDRPTNNFEYVFLLSKSSRYYYDADAIKEPQKEISLKRAFSTNHLKIRKDYGRNTYALSSQAQAETLAKLRHAIETGGDTRRHKRCVWTIPTHAYREAHFATFPIDLVKPMILAGTSHTVCSKCGAPWERVKEQNDEDSYGGLRKRADAPGAETSPTSVFRTGKIARYQTIDWQPTCNCNAETVKAIVLDPFMGAGTVAVVATELGRDFVGIELGEKYIEMANRRLAGITLPLPIEEFK